MGDAVLTLDDLTVPPPEPGPADWNSLGYVIAERLLPDTLIAAYQAAWVKENGDSRPGGWPDTCPYMRVPALMDLCTYGPMHEIMRHLVGEPVGVHLNLTGWVSTERNFHADSYLNPPEVGDSYVAVWMCLDDVHADAGPFEIVPGSHRWPVVTREKILAALRLTIDDEDWPKQSERILTQLYEREIERRHAEVLTYLPKRGDCLFWHGRTVHRGSRPKVAGAYRGALIMHGSGVNHRPDMPPAIAHGGGQYFPLDGGPV